MKICIVIVTYGNRFHLLRQVLDFFNQINQSEVKRIVLVDNGSTQESITKILSYQKYSALPIELVTIGFNSGSAKGFKSGIQKFLETECDFLYLLDDDNLPRKDALAQLITFWQKSINKVNYKSTSLLSNRIDRINFKKTLQSGNPDDMIQRKNNYLGFHWKDIVEKIKERWNDSKENEPINKPYSQVAASPYSGMFFHRDLITNIGLPDENYVLYFDDFDFSYRITNKGGEIWLIADSIVDDLENSVYLPKKKKILYHSLFEGKDVQMYYAFRNMLYFGKKYLRTNEFIYFIHKISFWMIISFMAVLNGKTSKLMILKDATSDAENECLGINKKYILN